MLGGGGTLFTDRFELPLTTASGRAVGAYERAVDGLLAGVGAPRAAAEEALAADPGFALAHSAQAMALFFEGRVKPARAAAARAVELATATTRRERQHAAIIADVVTGRREAALAKIRDHAVDFPRDAFAIDPAAGVFGLIGFSGRQDREAEHLALLEPLAGHCAGDWWYDSALAFALLEYDAVDRALPLVEAALEARPDSGHVAHTWVHALFEADRHDEALRWLEGWLPDYGAEGILYCHLWWHLALFHLLRRDFDAMWAAYDGHCLAGQSGSPAINLYTDGVSLAWRAEVAGAPRPVSRLQTLREQGEAWFPRLPVFVDVHRAACLAALGDGPALEAFRRDCREARDQGWLAAGDVVLQLADGFEAYANGDWVRAGETLLDAEPAVVRIGGSRAQRRLVTETRIAAAKRGAGP